MPRDGVNTMKRLKSLALSLMIASGMTGCASLCDEMISMEMGMRNHVLAQKAWGHWSWCYDDLDYPWHFAKGFKSGYRNVLDGGSGCQPTLPPQCYWKPAYQTPEGQCQIHAWFDGFSHGALAARQDGYGDMGQIPISPTARANFEASRMQPMPNAYLGGASLYGPAIGTPEDITAPEGEKLPGATDSRQLVPTPAGDKPPMTLRPYE